MTAIASANSVNPETSASENLLLEVTDLEVQYRIHDDWVPVVRSASVTVGPDEIVGLVGESGSGKSVTALACMGLTRSLGGRIGSGSIVVNGTDLTNASERQWRSVRGKDVGMVFQQPTRSLNPALTVGAQIADVARRHQDLTRKQAWEVAVDMLDQVQVPQAKERARDYPHQFSGGMCQRVAIAMSLVGSPSLLIADEPTTALDVTVQRHVLDLLMGLREERGFSVLLITHDLGVVAERCDRVAVMYAGDVVEQAGIDDLFTDPRHPYTDGLISAIPRRGRFGHELNSIRGQVPSPDDMPDGCRFNPRCDHAVAACASGVVPLLEVGPDRRSRCIRTDELELEGLGA